MDKNYNYATCNLGVTLNEVIILFKFKNKSMEIYSGTKYNIFQNIKILGYMLSKNITTEKTDNIILFNNPYFCSCALNIKNGFWKFVDSYSDEIFHNMSGPINECRMNYCKNNQEAINWAIKEFPELSFTKI